MKSTKLFWVTLVTFALVCCVAVGLTACQDEPHEHSLEHKVVKQATCTAEGNSEYWYCAGCGKYFSDEGKTETTLADVTIEKTAHHGGTATHTAQAVCDECHQPYGETLAHIYDQEVVDAKYLKSAATCKDYAVYYKSCEDGAFDPEGATFEYVAGGYADHKYEATDWKHDGNEHWHECEVCHDKLDKEAHSGGTATHFEKAVCEKCGEPYGETIAHVYDQEVVDAKFLKSAATCTHYAVYYKSCVDGAFDTDGATFDDVAGGYAEHDYTDVEWSKGEDGHWKVCKVCQTPTEPANHIPGPTATETDPQRCTECGYIMADPVGHTHQGTLVPEVKANCGEGTPGKKEHYTCTCGRIFEDEACEREILDESSLVIPAEHELDKTDFKDKTCTTNGNNEYYTCRNCNKVFEDEHAERETSLDKTVIPATHSPVEHTRVEPNCGTGESGTEAYWQCSVCNKYFQDENAQQPIDAPVEIPAEHTYEQADWKRDENEHWHKCEVCQQEIDKNEHSGGAATHFAKAVCEKCGESYGETIAHVYDQEVAEEQYLKSVATCVSYAVYYKSCEDGEFDPNGDTFEYEEGGFGDHSYNADYYCLICGDVDEERYDAVLYNGYASEYMPYVIENLTIGRLLVRGVKNGDVWFKLGDIDKNFVVQSLETAQGNIPGIWLKGAERTVYTADLRTGDKFRLAVDSSVDYAVITVGMVTRIEAENGAFTLAETAGNAHREVSDANNLRFDMGFSGWLSTANINRDGDSISYTFTADKDAAAYLRLYIAGHISYKGALDEMIQVTYGAVASNERGSVPVEELAKWNMDIKEGDYWTVHCNDSQYMVYRLVTLPIHVVEGENEIVITLGFGAAATMGGNLDYLEIISAANVTDFPTEMTLKDESETPSLWEVTVAPTISSTGTLKTTSYKTNNGQDRSREYTLPALAEDIGYNVYEEDGVYTYSFSVRGQTFTFTFNSNALVTITIDTDDDVTFVGGSKTAIVGAGERLPEIVNNTGREILGWYDTESPFIIWEGDTFMTSENDVKIAPYYPHANGEALQPGRRSDSDNAPCDQINDATISRDDYLDPVVVGGVIGATFRFSAAGGSDSRFRVVSKANIQAKTYTFYLTFQNFSDETITFEGFMVKSASDTANGVSTGSITLAKGEAKQVEVTITYTGTNTNSLLVLKFPNAVTNGYLGVAMSYSVN